MPLLPERPERRAHRPPSAGRRDRRRLPSRADARPTAGRGGRRRLEDATRTRRRRHPPPAPTTADRASRSWPASGCSIGLRRRSAWCWPAWPASPGGAASTPTRAGPATARSPRPQARDAGHAGGDPADPEGALLRLEDASTPTSRPPRRCSRPASAASTPRPWPRCKAQTVKNQVKLTAEAVATSIVSATDEKVVALVFVNQSPPRRAPRTSASTAAGCWSRSPAMVETGAISKLKPF